MSTYFQLNSQLQCSTYYYYVWKCIVALSTELCETSIPSCNCQNGNVGGYMYNLFVLINISRRATLQYNGKHPPTCTCMLHF